MARIVPCRRPETTRRQSRWPCAARHGKDRAMTNDRKNPTGAGAIIAFLIIGGAIVGGLMGQPSIGLLTGVGLGVLIAVLLWWRERDK
jgi:hypothetical protein